MPSPKILSIYDSIAPEYDRLLNLDPRDRADRAAFLDLVRSKLRPPATILDFGAGTGLDAETLLAEGYSMRAFEPSAGMRGVLESRIDLPIESDKDRTPLDGICANFAALNGVDELAPLFRRFAARLHPGGWLFFSVLNPLRRHSKTVPYTNHRHRDILRAAEKDFVLHSAFGPHSRRPLLRRLPGNRFLDRYVFYAFQKPAPAPAAIAIEATADSALRIASLRPLTFVFAGPEAQAELGDIRTSRDDGNGVPLWTVANAPAWRPTAADDFELSPVENAALRRYYATPRPVYLISVKFAGKLNVFPMDLVGPLEDHRVLFALRKTTPAHGLLAGSRKWAAALLPKHFKEHAYRLGRQHRVETIEEDALGFETQKSGEFNLPVPKEALQIEEFELSESIDQGSHRLLIGRRVSASPRRDGAAFGHAFL